MDPLIALRQRLRMASRARERAAATGDRELRRLLLRRAAVDPLASVAEQASSVDTDSAPNPTGTEGGTILSCRHLTPDHGIFRVAKPPGFQFEPGQHVRLEVNGRARPFTIVSAPHEAYLEFFVERAPGGGFTPGLWSMKPGDRIGVAPRAKGALLLDTSRSDHLMVATVTGIAPFVSMLRHAFAHGAAGDQRFHVLHGASYAEELGYADELARLPITYVPTLSRPEDPRNRGWGGATGRVHTLVDAHRAAHRLLPKDTAVYACGHPEMVLQVENTLGPRGYRIRTERFFKTRCSPVKPRFTHRGR